MKTAIIEAALATLCLAFGLLIAVLAVNVWTYEARMQEAWELEKDERIEEMYINCVQTEFMLPDGDPTRC